MKANRKFKEDGEAVSAVIGVILMVAITVAIAATVYVYVSGMLGDQPSGNEDAVVTMSSSGTNIKLLLTTGGNNIPDDGYTDYSIMINGTAIGDDNVVGGDVDAAWDVGTSIYVEQTSEDDALVPGVDYDVTVKILETVVLDSSIEVKA